MGEREREVGGREGHTKRGRKRERREEGGSHKDGKKEREEEVGRGEGGKGVDNFVSQR